MITVLNEQLAEAGANAGMAVAASHADRVSADWSRDALDFFRLFAQQRRGEAFMTEEVRAWAEKMGFPPPPDNRAWGHVAKRALLDGVVRHAGYGRQRSATCHGSLKTLWKNAQHREAA